VFVFLFSIALCSYSLQAIWLFSIISLKPVQYDGQDYPKWAIVVGWMLGMISLLPIPLMMIVQIINTDGDTILEVFKIIYLLYKRSSIQNNDTVKRNEND
jgi:hypothetical protein